MHSAVIHERRSCSACLVRQPIHQRPRIIVPFVLNDPSSQTPALPTDIEQTVSRRFEPSSRSLLMGEHPHPWLLLHSQVRKSRRRCSKPRRRYIHFIHDFYQEQKFELLGATTLLSPE